MLVKLTPSESIKAVRKHVDEIDTRFVEKFEGFSEFLSHFLFAFFDEKLSRQPNELRKLKFAGSAVFVNLTNDFLKR